VRRTLTALLLVLGVAGCGTSSTHPALRAGPQSCVPKEGAGVVGACAPKVRGLGQKSTLTGRFVPDVSYYQPHVNWRAAKAWGIRGAIVRVADGHFNDPVFTRYWHELKALGLWHAAYYFLRPYNCAGQADRAVGLVNAAGGLTSGPLITDSEVPLNHNCAQTFVQRVEVDTHWNVSVIYTSPGTWAGGGHGTAVLWVASYGPTPGCVWTCGHVSWQYTDGIYGPSPRCISGIGCGDVSLDSGLTAITRTSPAPARGPLEGRQAVLRRVLIHYGCRARGRKHERLGPRCKRWKAEGDRIHAALAAA
jgi:Glycosyl hydrolases family 25